MLIDIVLILFTFIKIICSMISPGIFRHVNCRNSLYPRSAIQRYSVPDELVFWSQTYINYKPPEHTASHINGQPWADPDLASGSEAVQMVWNHNDGIVNRMSYHGNYEIQNGVPKNPFGRTGVIGRGLLGRWGPNHAADPIVTRWKRNQHGEIETNELTGRQILQLIVIQRRDNHKWAIPGGMVDPGEKVTTTLKREFAEEALNSTDKADMVEQFFSEGTEVYKGYVDDFRNTDNSWIETVAFNFHDEKGSRVGKFELTAGDDAANVCWLDINGRLVLHANHIDIVKEVATQLNADW